MPATAVTRPPRNGPMLRQRSAPERSSAGCAAVDCKQATASATVRNRAVLMAWGRDDSTRAEAIRSEARRRARPDLRRPGHRQRLLARQIHPMRRFRALLRFSGDIVVAVAFDDC